MAISALSTPTPCDVVGDAAALVRSLSDVDWSARDGSELVAVIEELQALRATAHAVQARLLAEVEVQEVARKLGWASTSDWFTHLAGIRVGEGKRTVEQATELVRRRPTTLSALTSGAISPEQAGVVLDAVDRLPGDNALHLRAEEVLLDEAERLTATELARTSRRLIEVIDPDGSARSLEATLDREDRVSHQRRFLSITDDGMGGVSVKGRGSVEDGAILRAALLPLTAPPPPPDKTCAQLPDRRDFGVRMWDALVRTAQHSLDTDFPPDSHGARPRVAVTTDLAVLRGELVERGTTDDGLELAPSAVRRLACDADIIPVALGTEGEVLDVGRVHRLVTAPLWRALVRRDRHCAFPGCTRPPVMCQAHHVVAWASGGSTSLSNLVLLCGHHHRTVHRTPWEIRISSEDRLPEFRPPPDIGRERRWARTRTRRE